MNRRKVISKVGLMLALLCFMQVFLPCLSFAEEELTQNEQIQDLQENMNKAVSSLKSQITSVQKDNTDAKVSGEIRFGWQNPMEKATGVNGFDLTRAYLTFKNKLAGGASMRLTLDAGRVSTTAGSAQLYDYVKYAYVELPMQLAAGMPFSLTFKLGLQHNMWIDWADKIWDNAFMMKQFVDNEGIMSSADLGLGVAGKVTLSPTLPEVEYQATVLNGTGYKSTEANNAKDIGLRLSSDIYQNENVGTVVLGCYGNLKDSLDNTAASTQQVGYLLALKNETWGNLYLEGVYGKTVTKSSINGISIGGFLNLPKECLPLTLVTRFDNYDPDGNVANDLKSKTLWGVVYKYSEAVRIAYDVQTTQTGAGALSRTAYLHSMITF